MSKNKRIEPPDCLQIPPDVGKGSSLIRCIGNQELVIENYRSIKEYEKNLIILTNRNGEIKITGHDFRILYYTHLEIRISGWVESITFLY